ncbi:hypothetical protein LshimejAT787_0211790 [Lyophyllum shimeji]|uniref:Uncharacterized protein n=1 Tax=Lyophyllum shimeji TaxID=47721 RepID=A0A9P3PHK5_LYOSH|nr:hypothetical protein LshimejAT787_0211790 [Lyophyllum shimeji]
MNHTLFTLALILALFTIASALPTTSPNITRKIALAKPPVPAAAPRSLLGRYYLRHSLAANPKPSTFSKPARPAVLPADGDDFAGRADRFQVLQRRRAARASALQVKVPVHRDLEGDRDARDSLNSLLSHHTVAAAAPAESPAHAHAHASTQVQAPLAVATTHARARAGTGTLKHHAVKKAVAEKQMASL